MKKIELLKYLTSLSPLTFRLSTPPGASSVAQRCWQGSFFAISKWRMASNVLPKQHLPGGPKTGTPVLILR